MSNSFCSTCKFFLNLTKDGGYPSMNEGVCRRYPPHITTSRIETHAEFPPVKGYHWCGEFRYKDVKS